ncbi:Copper-exporting P-type ATPase A [compost metagenome]
MKKETLKIEGMTCAACARRIEKVTNKINGVSESNVNFATEKLLITYDNNVELESIKIAIEKAGYKAVEIKKQNNMEEDKLNKEKSVNLLWTKFIVSAIFSIPLLYIAMGSMMGLPVPNFINPMQFPLNFSIIQILLVIPSIIAGYKFYTIGFSSIASKSPNMDSLIAMGTTAAFIYSVYGVIEILNGELGHVENLYFETVGVIITLILLRKNIRSCI